MIRFIFLVIVFGIYTYVGSSVFKEAKSAVEEDVAHKIHQYYHLELLTFKSEIQNFNLIEASGVTEEDLKKSFLQLREVYKKTELFLNYLDNNETKNLNGANIVINEYDSLAPMEEKQPHGLQVMEDLIYNPGEDTREALRQEIEMLDELVTKFLRKNEQHKIESVHDYHVFVWDALRYEIYRIESVGITGFDVPDSKNSLPETKVALASVFQVIKLYQPLFEEKQMKNHLLKAKDLFLKADNYLEDNPNFDSFDRLVFIIEYLHPVSEWLSQSVEKLGYKYPVNVRPLDTDAIHLFDKNILNGAYFSPNSTHEKIELGKKLFNDKIFSSDGSRSCATCHIPDKGFADGMIKNTSVSGDELLLRNTPSLWNVGFQSKQFYDSRVNKLEKQNLDVIHNKHEMGGDLRFIVSELQKSADYMELFQKAFGGRISEFTVVSAISDYLRSLVSFNSRFDQYIRGEDVVLSDSEKNGFNLFMGKAKCATCHFPPLFNGLLAPFYTDSESEILGVPAHASKPEVIDSDPGKYGATGLELHKFSFKTPGIRNSELTAPYMHNGVYATLEEVINFYDQGGGAGRGMNLPQQTLPSDSLGLSEREKSDLVRFIQSLTSEF